MTLQEMIKEVDQLGIKAMTDNSAVLDGFTKEVMATSEMYDLHLLLKPDTFLDDRFKAWDCDNQEYIMVNGWLFVFEFDDDTD